MLHTVFPHEAANINRLMGLRKVEDETKVKKIKTVPTREKQEATRSTVSSDLSWLGVSEETIFRRDGRGRSTGAQQRRCAVAPTAPGWGSAVGTGSIHRTEPGNAEHVRPRMAQEGAVMGDPCQTSCRA